MEPGKGRKREENRKKKRTWIISVLSPIKEDPELIATFATQ